PFRQVEHNDLNRRKRAWCGRRRAFSLVVKKDSEVFRIATEFMKCRSTFLSFLLIGFMASVFVPDSSALMRLQSSAVLQGRVVDMNGAVVPRAQVTAQN